MTTRPYYTLCLWDADHNSWFDECGDYSRADVQADADGYYDMPKRHKVIIATDGSAAAMIAARDALPTPKP